MKQEFLARCCRICLGKSRKLRSLYTPTEEGELSPSEMLQLITGIFLEKVEENQMFPKNICKNCELSLTMAYEFRKKALENQKLLTIIMKKSTDDQTSIEEGQIFLMSDTATTSDQETEGSNLIVQNQDMDDDIIEVNPMMELDVLEEDTTASLLLQEDYEQETVNELRTSENINSISNRETNTVEQTVQDVYVENIELHQEDENVNEERIYELKEAYVGEEIEGVIVIEDVDDALEVTEDNLIVEEHLETFDTVRTKVTRLIDQNVEDSVTNNQALETDVNNSTISHISKSKSRYENELKVQEFSSEKNKENCTKDNLSIDEIDLTGVESENITKITNSRQTYNPKSKKDKFNYICDICGNVYDRRSRMMEHRQRHDKELKYMCELCDKKFHMRELLRKHMYLHSGGKPFKCDYCSRTFYYESVRKAHMDVHKGLRPFVCKVCSKSFSYSHALKKHELIHAEIKLYRCIYCKKDFRLQHHMKQHTLTKMHKKVVRMATERGEYLSDSNDTKDNMAPTDQSPLTTPLILKSEKMTTTATTATTTTRIQIEPDDRKCKIRHFNKSRNK